MDWSGKVDREGWRYLLPTFSSLVALPMDLPSIGYLMLKSKLLMSEMSVWRGLRRRQAKYQGLPHSWPANLD